MILRAMDFVKKVGYDEIVTKARYDMFYICILKNTFSLSLFYSLFQSNILALINIIVAESPENSPAQPAAYFVVRNFERIQNSRI